MAYQGFFRPKNPQKYDGDPSKIVYRSSWENLVFEWMDNNPGVEKWVSEETVINYQCKTDGKPHRYFVDIKVTYTSGKTVLIEIKPHCQTMKPKISKGKKNKTILTEAFTYVKNRSKWDAAEEYCRARGWTFQIWTEHTLESIGIRLPNRSNVKR